MFRLELDPPGESLGNGRLPDAGLAEQEHGVRPLAMAEHLEDLVHLALAAEHRWHLVLACELVQIGGKVLQERRQLETFFQPLLVDLVIPHPRREPRHERLWLDPVATDY